MISRIPGASRRYPIIRVTRDGVTPPSPYDFGRPGDLSGFQEISPPDCYPEEFDYSRGLRLRGRFGIAPAGWDCAWHLVRRYPARQCADASIFERPLGPEGCYNLLFATGGHGGARMANLGKADDPEPDFRLCLAVSRAGPSGSLCHSIISVEGSVICVLPRWLQFSNMHPLHPSVEGVLFLSAVLLPGTAIPKRFRV